MSWKISGTLIIMIVGVSSAAFLNDPSKVSDCTCFNPLAGTIQEFAGDAESLCENSNWCLVLCSSNCNDKKDISSGLFGGNCKSTLACSGVSNPAETQTPATPIPPTPKELDYNEMDYVVNDFNDEFLDISASEEAVLFEQPEILKLHVNVYLDPYWRKQHISEEWAVKEAKATMDQASVFFKHSSLRTKIELEFDDTIYNSSKHILHNDIDGMLFNELRAPFRYGNDYHVVHVYLTANPNPKKIEHIGLANSNSMCSKDKKAPRIITYWKANSVRTGLTVAHELGHVLGMKHDFLPAWDQHNKQVRDKCTSDEIPPNSGILIMNYGQPRVRWSDCSNEDFARYYQSFVARDKKFCLEKRDIGCNSSECPNTCFFKGEEQKGCSKPNQWDEGSWCPTGSAVDSTTLEFNLLLYGTWLGDGHWIKCSCD